MVSSKLFPFGKLDPEYLSGLLKKSGINDPRVRIGPEIGEDCAVIDTGDQYLLAKTDPITFVGESIGWYCTIINANDIAVMGGIPKWFLANLLLPETITKKEIDKIFTDLDSSLTKMNVALCGGHTEVTPGLNRPVLIGTMLGEVQKDKLIDKRKIEEGDDILLVKGIAIEGTSIIARETKDELFSETVRDRAVNFIHDPGISVVKEAAIAAESGKLHGMHDPTEGGLLGGIWELAFLAKTGFFIDYEKIFIYLECKTFTDFYKMNPLQLIASGALVIVAPPSETENIIKAFGKKEIPCIKIGRMTGKEEGYLLKKENKTEQISPPFTDEIEKLFK